MEADRDIGQIVDALSGPTEEEIAVVGGRPDAMKLLRRWTVTGSTVSREGSMPGEMSLLRW